MTSLSDKRIYAGELEDIYRVFKHEDVKEAIKELIEGFELIANDDRHSDRFRAGVKHCIIRIKEEIGKELCSEVEE